MNYKNTISGEIISEECYNKLPSGEKHKYHKVEDGPTHRYESRSSSDDDDSFSLNPLSSFGLGGFSSGDDSFSGFGGGSFGGGGASGDW